MNRSGRYILFCMLLASTVGMALAAEKSSALKMQAGTFQVKATKDYLSLDANEAPLAKIFEEIGKQTGIAVESGMGPDEKITIRLDRVPLEEGFKRLAKNVSVFYSQDPKDKTARITRVVVLSEGKARPLSRGPAPTQTSKSRDPAPKPEPFKFDFDPAKSVEKEKPVKAK